MNRTYFNLLSLLSAILLVCGCGKVAPEQEARDLFGKGDFKQAIRTIDTIIDSSRDEKLVNEMQVLKGQSLISLADADRKILKEDSAITYLEQATIALSAAIEFGTDDPEAYYQRAIAYEMLGNEAEAYRDTLAAKAIDPEHKTAYTNEVVPDELSLETKKYELELDSGNKRDVVPKGLLAEKDEETESSETPSERNSDRDEPYAYENDRSDSDRDPYRTDSNEHEGEEADENERPRRGYAFSPDGEDGADENGSPAASSPNTNEGSIPRRSLSRRRNSIARSPNALEPLEPSAPEEDPNELPGRFPFPYSQPIPAPSVSPIQPPSTGVTGNHSRLQPNFNPTLPTTGYSGGGPLSQNGLLRPGPTSGTGALANGPTGPTTGYSGGASSGVPRTNFHRAPSYMRSRQLESV